MDGQRSRRPAVQMPMPTCCPLDHPGGLAIGRWAPTLHHLWGFSSLTARGFQLSRPTDYIWSLGYRQAAN